MPQQKNTPESFDCNNPQSIFDYTARLIGHSLKSLLGDEVARQHRKGKGGLGQMVEELFFGYKVNSNPEADFADAHLELKCTPLKRSGKNNELTIKERLVCTMIDYAEIATTAFDDSHLIAKCRLMLLLFYLYTRDRDICEYEFIYRVLWQLPEKDLILIKRDYETIAEKVRKGQAHLISEGDTLYLGACRKGQKGDSPQPQPFSEIKAFRRAFSLKPSYMRYVLQHVVGSADGSYSNYRRLGNAAFELTDAKALQSESFEDIILRRFSPYYGLNYVEICDRLGVAPYQSKSKYADVSNLIASEKKSKRISASEEFLKSGIILKTVRLRANGMPKESMAFKNIDYCEVFENDSWPDSEAYEIFTSRFMFVVFTPSDGEIFFEDRTGKIIREQSYVLSKVFFWTMPAEDLENARAYWKSIRRAVIGNKIELGSFWSISDDRDFHVRPKAQTKIKSIAVNPNGGYCEKFCYWMNARYVKQIIDSES